MIKDINIANMLRQVKGALRDNKPVLAYEWLQDLEKYLEAQSSKRGKNK